MEKSVSKYGGMEVWVYKRRKSPTEVDPRMPPEIQVLEGLSKRAHFDYRNARFETFSSRSAAEAF